MSLSYVVWLKWDSVDKSVFEIANCWIDWHSEAIPINILITKWYFQNYSLPELSGPVLIDIHKGDMSYKNGEGNMIMVT